MPFKHRRVVITKFCVRLFFGKSTTKSKIEYTIVILSILFSLETIAHRYISFASLDRTLSLGKANFNETLTLSRQRKPEHRLQLVPKSRRDLQTVILFPQSGSQDLSGVDEKRGLPWRSIYQSHGRLSCGRADHRVQCLVATEVEKRYPWKEFCNYNTWTNSYQ